LPTAFCQLLSCARSPVHTRWRAPPQVIDNQSGAVTKLQLADCAATRQCNVFVSDVVSVVVRWTAVPGIWNTRCEAVIGASCVLTSAKLCTLGYAVNKSMPPAYTAHDQPLREQDQ